MQDTLLKTQKAQRATWLLAGAAIGGLLIFFFDASRGRRRRALVMDQVVHFRKDALWYTGRQLRNLGNHIQGWLARTASRISEARTIPDDEILVLRVRSEMGRKVRHPRSIEVTARSGRITLRGQVLGDEVQQLFDCVRNVRGVQGVRSELEVHKNAEHVPGLQGEGKSYLRGQQVQH